MDEDKLPLKRVELSLTKFNEVAIPHHLDLLRQHKNNIIKYERGGQAARARREQTHARRVAVQLRVLLQELAELRARVRPHELARFDALTQHARDSTLAAVLEYLGLIESSCMALAGSSSARPPRLAPARVDTSPLAINREPEAPDVAGSATSTESVGVLTDEQAEQAEGQQEQLQLQVDEAALQLRSREELLRGWAELQAELAALHGVWRAQHAAAQAQRECAGASAACVARAGRDVGAARAQLAAAERLRGVAFGASGALAGALLGGPVGLAVGAKAGALAAAAGSLLGFLGVRALAGREPPPAPAPRDDAKDDEQ